MNRQELEHIVRAAAGITGERLSAAPHSLRLSMQVDIYPKVSCRPWAALIGK